MKASNNNKVAKNGRFSMYAMLAVREPKQPEHEAKNSFRKFFNWLLNWEWLSVVVVFWPFLLIIKNPVISVAMYMVVMILMAIYIYRLLVFKKL